MTGTSNTRRRVPGRGLAQLAVSDAKGEDYSELVLNEMKETSNICI
jgi:hypothetical protein